MARNPRNPGSTSASHAAESDIGNDVGIRLKAFYEAVETAPLPDVFLDLLEKLDAAERQTSGQISED